MRKTIWLVLLGVAGAATPARAQEGGGPLSVDGGLVIWTLVVFAMLLYLLRRHAWPVLLAAVREREQKLERQLAEAEKQRQEAAALLEEQQRLFAAAHAEAQEILSKAKGVATKEREALLARTREEQEQLLDRARREIEAEKEKAILALRKEAVDLAIAAASKLIEQKLDDEANRRLGLEYLASLEQPPRRRETRHHTPQLRPGADGRRGSERRGRAVRG